MADTNLAELEILLEGGAAFRLINTLKYLREMVDHWKGSGAWTEGSIFQVNGYRDSVQQEDVIFTCKFEAIVSMVVVSL